MTVPGAVTVAATAPARPSAPRSRKTRLALVETQGCQAAAIRVAGRHFGSTGEGGDERAAAIVGGNGTRDDGGREQQERSGKFGVLFDVHLIVC